MDNLIWINNRTVPFETNAILYAIEHVELGLDIVETDWWMQRFAAHYWSEWSVVFRLNCLRLLKKIATHPAEIAAAFSEMHPNISSGPTPDLTRIMDSLERIIKEADCQNISIWTIHKEAISDSKILFSRYLSGDLLLPSSLPHIEEFLLKMTHEEKIAKKDVIQAKIAFNRWKKEY